MSTLRFLFACLSSPGFVFPAVPIATRLRALGHEVAFVTGSEQQEALEEEGLRRIPRGDKDGPSFQVPVWFQPMPIALQYRHIEYAMKQFRADVLVSSMLTLGPLFARDAFQIPCAVIGSLVYLWPSSDTLAAEADEAERRRAWRHGDMLRYLNEARTLFKLPALDASPRSSPFLADLYLQRSVPSLAGALDELPEQVHLVGECAWEPRHSSAELTAWLDEAKASGEPIYYVQQGRAFQNPAFWPHLVEALRDRPVRVAASVGRMDVPVGEIPSTWFVRPLVPQRTVMPHARAVIASGTTTAALSALGAGKPTLVIAGGGEQDDVAELLRQHEAALCVPAADVSRVSLCDLIDELLQRSDIEARARKIAVELAQLDGPTLAADLLVRLGRGESVTRVRA